MSHAVLTYFRLPSQRCLGRFVAATLLVVYLAGTGASAFAGGDLEGLLRRLERASGQKGLKLQVVKSSQQFSRVFMDARSIEVSTSFLKTLQKRAGTKGLAFVLGHEMAHMDPRIRSVRGPAVELLADRQGYKIASKAVGPIPAKSVSKALHAYDLRGGRWQTFGNRIKTALHFSHPTDTVRLQNLARAEGYSRRTGWDRSARGGFVAMGRTGGLPKAATSLKGDFLRGGLVTNLTIGCGLVLASKYREHRKLGTAVGETLREVAKPTFLVGNLLGGTLGAALGAMIPIPAAIAGAGLLGSAAAALPVLAVAMVGSRLGMSIVSQLQAGDGIDWGEVLGEARLGTTLLTAAGAALGMTVGALFPGLPAIGALAGGLLGGFLADRLAGALFGVSELGTEVQASTQEGPLLKKGKHMHSNEVVSTASVSKTLHDLAASRDMAYRKAVAATADGDRGATARALDAYERTGAALAIGMVSGR